MPRKGENIYKRKDGRWEGRYIKSYDLNHKAKYASVYARTYTEVKRKLIIARNNIAESVEVKNDSFVQLTYKWLRETKPQVKHSTFVKYTNITNNHVIPYFLNLTIDEITNDLLKKFISEKLQNGSIAKKNLSPKTVKDIMSVIKLILKYGETLGYTSKCNFDSLTIKSSAVVIENISDNCQNKLIEYLLTETDYTKLGILICLYTGVRIGELCAITIEDIYLEEKIIRITKTMQRIQNFSEKVTSKTSIYITSPKSQSSQRDIPLPDFLAEIIGSLEYEPRAYILTGKNDKYIEPRTLENRFKSCLKKCGLSDYNFHQLRHRFATQCIEHGFDLKCLSEILGHSSVNITLNRYVHTTMDLKRKNMNKLQCTFAY